MWDIMEVKRGIFPVERVLHNRYRDIYVYVLRKHIHREIEKSSRRFTTFNVCAPSPPSQCERTHRGFYLIKAH